MKYGIITDIHANIEALNVALQEFEKRNVDRIICCGDIIGIGPHPEETVQKLMKVQDKLIAVRGNHEGYLLDGIPKMVHQGTREMSETEVKFHLWTHHQLSDSSKAFLASLPMEKVIEEGTKRINVMHYPAEENGQYKMHIKVPNVEECRTLFENYQGDVELFGHTHLKDVIQDSDKRYINVGSLGCPMQERTGARCGILSIVEDNVKLEELKLGYDVEKVTREIAALQYPMYEKILRVFFGQ